MMQRPDNHARCWVVRSPLAAAAAVVLGALGVTGCESVPDYANPVEWYGSVVDAIDGEDPAAPGAPAPDVQIGAGAPPADIIAVPAAAPGVGPGVARAQVSPFGPSTEIASAPGAGGAVPDIASAPGASQPFPSLSLVPDAPPKEATQTDLAAVAEGLVADRERARYTGEVFRRERAGEQVPAPAPAPALAPAPVPAPAPPLALAAAAPVVRPPAPPTVSARPPGAPVDVIDIFGRNYSASGPYAVAPPAPDLQIAATSALPSLAPLGPPATSGSIYARQPPGPGRLAALDTTAVVSNSAVVRFGVGSARISAKGRKSLRAVAGAHRLRGGVVRVVGHASSRTRELPMERHNLVNFEVSLARAQAVVDQLMRFGVAPGSVFVSAKSDSEPIYYEWMPSGEAGNRRVEVFIDF